MGGHQFPVDVGQRRASSGHVGGRVAGGDPVDHVDPVGEQAEVRQAELANETYQDFVRRHPER
ncbi:hypothetical protein D2L64_02410 [Micromonospora radicis]|uniref:Uncharacterized protein n=1 Tax=Micromonospora radicis TaxID=1894971 RepID=A0A418N173_9ACTN|nr:hypothetical protein D2L64_02410 [Micromonospora radicis]